MIYPARLTNVRGRIRVLTTKTVLPLPIDRVFEFFGDAANLERITPEFLRFKILTPQPIEMHAGALIDYRIRLMGIPMRWLTEITFWDPPHRFVDAQIRGPYRKWVHEHSFRPMGDQTEMTDRVEYIVPGGLLEPVIHALFVGPSIRRIFGHRAKAIKSLLDVDEVAIGGHRRQGERDRSSLQS